MRQVLRKFDPFSFKSLGSVSNFIKNSLKHTKISSVKPFRFYRANLSAFFDSSSGEVDRFCPSTLSIIEPILLHWD